MPDRSSTGLNLAGTAERSHVSSAVPSETNITQPQPVDTFTASDTGTTSESSAVPASAKPKRHRDMLMVALFVVVCSFSFRVVDGQQVAFRWWPSLVVPETCGSRSWFGVECPGCGLTRSFIYLAQGDLQRSLAVNRVGWVMALSVLIQVPYRIAALRSSRPVVPPLLCKWFGNALIAMLILNWTWNQFQRYL